MIIGINDAIEISIIKTSMANMMPVIGAWTMDARAAAQSSAGYNLASKTAGTTGTAQEPLTAPSNITVATQAKQTAGTTTAAAGKTITIDADLKLTDKAGQIIAEVVNSYNKKIEVGVGG